MWTPAVYFKIALRQYNTCLKYRPSVGDPVDMTQLIAKPSNGWPLLFGRGGGRRRVRVF